MFKKLLACLLCLWLILSAFYVPASAEQIQRYYVMPGDLFFHLLGCDQLHFQSYSELTVYDSAQKAIFYGYKPCDVCSPVDPPSTSTAPTDAASLEDDWQYQIGHLEGYQEGLEYGKEHAVEEATHKLTEAQDAKSSAEAQTLIAAGFAALAALLYFLDKSEEDKIKKLKQQVEKEKNATQSSAHIEREKIKNLETLSLKRIASAEAQSKITIQNEKNAIAQSERELKALASTTRQNHPELASRIADAQYYLDMRSYDRLLYQKRPALKAAEEVKKIATEKRQLMQVNRQLQYQLDFYEGLFPWLEEFKEVPSDEAIAYATGSYGSDYDAVKKWLSPAEYEKLSNAEKYQLALDRWKNRKKEDWDVGIEYERYIGYRLECEGYKVSYPGAILGLKDMGRDLLASKDGKTLVIQCKRWAKEKTIHEKHIFQLYGSTAVLAAEHPDTKYKAVFVTTASLSDTAKKCAEYCDITVVANCPMGNYPLIKCNANKDGEKIYHLPFDQQYDKVVISKNKQSCYAWTTQEAEDMGFRRAYRWRPNKS